MRKPEGTPQLIDALERTLRAQLERLARLQAMDPVLLCTRPAPGRWSVVEVAEHINLSSGHYFRLLRKAYADPHSGLRYRPTFTPGRFGEMGVKAMQPSPEGTISWRMRTLGMFEPRTAATSGTRSMDELRSMLEGFVELLNTARQRGIEGVRITSTLGPVLRFRTGDAFRFPIAHQERHLLQMERTVEAVKQNAVPA
jgi:hypothetical protein